MTLPERLRRATGHPWRRRSNTSAVLELVGCRLVAEYSSPDRRCSVRIYVEHERLALVWQGVPEHAQPIAARMCRRLPSALRHLRPALFELELGDWLTAWRRRVDRRRRRERARARPRPPRPPQPMQLLMPCVRVEHDPRAVVCSRCDVRFTRGPGRPAQRPLCPFCRSQHV